MSVNLSTTGPLGSMIASLKGLRYRSLLRATRGPEQHVSTQQGGGPSIIQPYLKSLIERFEANLGYTGPRPGDNCEGLVRGMHEEARKTGIEYPIGSHSWFAFKTGFFHTYVSIDIIESLDPGYTFKNNLGSYSSLTRTIHWTFVSL